MWHNNFVRKYWTVFTTSWSNGFVYRFNFWLWRVRSVLVVLTIYFLWDAVFQNNPVVAGYTRDKILTYVFLTLVLRSVILGQRSIDAAGEIASGKLTNYLVKPLNYHLYWFTRDLADKLLNIIFVVFETIALYFILRPPIFLQSDPLTLVGFTVAVAAAILLNFILGNISSNFSFWMPGNAWGFWFLYLVFQDFLGGVMYPLDIFPQTIQKIIMLLPFPYLLFFPANVYLGKISAPDYFWGLTVVLFWLTFCLFTVKKIWLAGVKDYQAEGR
jgi:ABC-2 type transport system permease protein